MGRKLGLQFAELWQEVASVHAKWREYKVLYDTKKSRIDLLNRAAPRFFRLVQDALWDDTVLHVARGMDLRRDALTVRKLPSHIDEPSAKRAVQKLVDVAVSKSESCKKLRDNYIAHRNLLLAINPESVKPLKRPSSREIDEALDSITAVLNAVSLHY